MLFVFIFFSITCPQVRHTFPMSRVSFGAENCAISIALENIKENGKIYAVELPVDATDTFTFTKMIHKRML